VSPLKLSIEWLKDYIEIPDGIQKLSDDFTMSGSEVEAIEKPFENLKNLVTAKIVEIDRHPNADNLNVCKIEDGKRVFTIVTSDKTLKVNDCVIFGQAGKASDINGKVVQSVEMRGIGTDGMLFSLQEIGLEAHSSHVFKFDKYVEPGQNIVDLFGLDLTTFELEITPNRSDCLSHFGLARELSTVEKRSLKLPVIDLKLPYGNVSLSVESEGCYRYMAVRIDDVLVGDSPLWLKKRLASVGIRSINNITDITNYVMMEFGHPIHAFDFDKIQSSMIVVRDAKAGELFTALNSKVYKLNGGEILITDGQNALALAGIMGGKDSGISSSTTRILLEVATFDPVRTRKTSKILNLSTDASYRFERFVDPNDTEYTAKRLVQMILSLCGGKVVGSADLYPQELKPLTVKVSDKKLSTYLSFKPDEVEVKSIFESLGMDPSHGKDGWKVEVPTFRHDISQDVDLIEEVARIHGFNALPVKRSMPFVEGERNDWWEFKNVLRAYACALGYFEAINYAFSDPELLKLFGSTFEEGVKVANPISPEMSVMRSTLIFNLIDSLAYNVKHQEVDVNLFEIGKIFHENFETEKLALVSTGKIESLDYTDKREWTLLNFKGTLESLLAPLHVHLGFINEELDGFTNGRSGRVTINGKISGIIGELSSQVLDFFDVKVPIYAVEIDLKTLYGVLAKSSYSAYSQYPFSFKDLSMFVQKGAIKAVDIIDTVKRSSTYVNDVEVIDLYTGKGVPYGTYSITLRITYGSMERTLLEEEIDGAFTSLMSSLESKNGITLRKV